MSYDYFYGAAGACQYVFFRIPKLLVRGEQFHDISTDAKLLYGLMLDRLQLSIKNRWFDEDDRVYIVYTIEDIMEDLNCGNQKAVKTLGELEKKAGLIIKKRRGLGKPSIIYVLNFYSARHNKHGGTGWNDDVGTSGGSDEDYENMDSEDRDIQKFENHISEVDGIITRKCENHTSGNVMPTSFKMCESQCNKNNQNKTEISNNNPINPILENEKLSADDWQNTISDGSDEMAERRKYESYLWEHLGMDGLLITYKYYGEMLKVIFNIILDTITSKSRYIRCTGEDKPAEVVKAQFMKLDISHIEYVIGSLDGKHIAVKGRGQKRYIRLDSLGDGYDQESLIDRFNAENESGKKHEIRHDGEPVVPDLLIDIQKKALGKGAGYAVWAKKFNLKQTGKTLQFLQSVNIHGRGKLDKRARQASEKNALMTEIRSREKRLKEISELKRHIINYSKTRECYQEYRKSGYSRKFFEAHREELTLHKAAKEAFDWRPEKKPPKLRDLSHEYEAVLSEKKKNATKQGAQTESVRDEAR